MKKIFILHFISFIIFISSYPCFAQHKYLIANSMNCFPYNTTHYEDIEIDYFDNPLDWDTSLSWTEDNRKKIQNMIQAGVDVLEQTVFYADGLPDPDSPYCDTTRGLNKVSSMLDAAQTINSEFKVAPQIIRFKMIETYGKEDFVLFLKKIKDKFKDHPNIFIYNNKIVLFLYNPFEDIYGNPSLSQIGPDDLADVWDGYEALGVDYNREDFYVVNETYYCVKRFYYLNYWDEAYIQEMLGVVDNIYFWHIFQKDYDMERNNTLMSSLDIYNSDEHFIAAVEPQYFRRNTGGCIPSEGTELVRSVWKGRVQHPNYQPEWIILCTWDDYSENTVFEASKFNRGFYASLIHSLANAWKNHSLPESELWLTLPTVIMRGEKIHIELVGLNNPLPSRSFTIELYDPVTGFRKGTSGILSVPDDSLYNGAVQVYSFDIYSTMEMYAYVNAVFPRISIEEPGKSTITAWGPPIRISEHHTLNPLYQSYRVDRCRWPKVGKFTSFLSENLIDGGRKFHCAFQVENKTSQSQFKEIEFLTINKRTILKSSDFSNNLFSFSFTSKEHHEPLGLVYARIDYHNGDVFYSKPAIMNDNEANEITSLYDISDKKEWSKEGEYNVSFKEALIGHWNLANTAPVNFGFRGKSFKKITDSGAYGNPLYLGLGPNSRVFSGTEDRYPQFIQGEGYYFDGIDDVMRFPEHILPAGTLHIRIEIKALELKEAILLFHRHNAVKLKLFADGSLEFTRGTDINGELITTRTGQGGADHRILKNTDYIIEVRDYGDQLRIYLNDKLIAKKIYAANTRKYIEYADFWSDLMLVGGTYSEGQCFYGYFKGIKVHCSNPINQFPVANAGLNLEISGEDQVSTIILGTATDPDYDPLTYRWLNGETELITWQNVGANGEAYLDLGAIPYFSIGKHVLTLEISDGQVSTTDEMILTIENSAPHLTPSGGGVYEIYSDVTLGGKVSDFDGDLLSYKWIEESVVLFSGSSIQTIPRGDPVELPSHTISNLSLGIHTISLQVDDGTNAPVTGQITIEIVDTTIPTLSPVSNKTILWPPNHKMVNIIIEANANDNSRSPVTLTVEVTSNEPEDGLGDGDTAPDWTEPIIDQVNGIITLRLRAERSGSGNGRVYTINITAEDESDNINIANMEIIVPHDARKK